jgi:hypothetical protein
MRRREFIALIAGMTAVFPRVRAQQTDRVRRIGVLMSTTADDLQSRARIEAFLQAMQQLGWTNGGNLRIEIRWVIVKGSSSPGRQRGGCLAPRGARAAAGDAGDRLPRQHIA